MTVSLTGPVSLHAIRGSFNKSGRVAADDRYVRDFNQFGSEESWDLEAYRGQAYGLQHQIFNDGWAGGGFGASALPLDQTDKRIDGMVASRDGQSYVRLGEDSTGKYADVSVYQSSGSRFPGSVAMNGIFYASEAGSYRLTAKVETSGEFASTGEAGIFVFGYRYGYLDGDRANYVLWGNGEQPGPNKTLYCNQTFFVKADYRHIVVNVNSWLPGNFGGNKAKFRVRDLTIEKV